MSLLNDTRRRVEQHFWDRMAVERPGMFIKFENTVGENPSDRVWCALSMRPAVREQLGLGYAPRATGAIFVQLFAPLTQGTREIEDLADVVAEFFDGVRLETTTGFRSAEVIYLGEVEGWYQINLNIEFVTDTGSNG